MHDDERAVPVHGDVHQWNALQARSGFKLIDPDGLLAEAEYDMGVLMHEGPDRTSAGQSSPAGALADGALQPRCHRNLAMGRG